MEVGERNKRGGKKGRRKEGEGKERRKMEGKERGKRESLIEGERGERGREGEGGIVCPETRYQNSQRILVREAVSKGLHKSPLQ